jgi:hypothetical protein
LAEFKDGTAIEAAGWRKIDLFESSLHGKSSRLDVALNAVLAASGTFVICEQGEPIFKGEFGVLGIGLLLTQRFQKSGQAQFDQLVVQGLLGHADSF